MATSEGIPSSIDIEFLELNDNPYYRLINLLQNCEKHFKQDKPPVHDVNRWLFEPQVIFYEQKMTVS